MSKYNLDDPVELLCALTEINSVNSTLVPGAPGEAEIADFIGQWFSDRNFEVTRLEATPGRPSIVACSKGATTDSKIMLNGHIDTVTIASYEGDGLEAIRKDGNVYGRGTFDMKGGLAAQMVAAHRAVQRGIAGQVIVAAVSDEEHGNVGTEEVLKHFTADVGVVAEPTMLGLTVAHKGFVWFELTITGLAAHGSRHDLGIDAITKAGYALVALDKYAAELTSRPHVKYLETPSVHASIIKGGEELSSYPAECTIAIERRTVPGETPEAVRAELVAILDDVAASTKDFSYELGGGFTRAPLQVSEDHKIVSLIQNSFQAHTGKPIGFRGEWYWTDAALMNDAGITTVLFGVDGEGAHAATEWATESSVHTVADV
ncbi:MAG: M20/M25/M40 family metallo-hydrolase, partial [Actinobacteria bacterium]|nr:M20/M25/M40 family metallo-hydrolase [Actinomycetota bacterium]